MPGVRSNLQAQPAVKSILVYRNGEPGRGPRRVVVHEKRVSSLEALLRELSGGTRRLHTPQGHRVGALQDVQHRGAYVAAGPESFRKIDYLQIGNRNKQTHQSNGLMKQVPQNRIIVAARFLKPIKEPCTIFVVANGDVLNPAVRLLVPSRVLGQFERILEMITEKMGLRILGGVHSLYTFDGIPVMDGKDLENGQFYVAVGRDKFKRLPYADLLFTKPMGIRRVYRSKAASLPPIDGFRRHNGDLGNSHSKSTVGCGDSREAKASPPAHRTKEPVASLVREISQARLVTLRKKRSGLTMSLSAQENDDGEQKADGEDEESGEKDSGEEPSAAEQSQETTEGEGEGEDEGTGSEEAAQTAEEAAPAGENENENTEEENTGGDGEGEEIAQDDEKTTEPEEEEQAEEEQGQAEEEQGQAEEEQGQAEEEQEQAEEEQGQAEEEQGQAEEEQEQAEEEEGQADGGTANEEGEAEG
ncbi:doublecortin domain-containing protein 2-like [Salminus brasiliensis]|uniref:doublecortin domain-containing protein 2-like n=1 Tax=Salminus brasiliensis TaxID=930266 RepID=UPI003B83373D